MEDFLTKTAKRNGNVIKITTFWPQFGAALVVSLLQVGSGVVCGYTGIALPSMVNGTSQAFFLSQDQVPIYSSSLMVGSLAGSLLSGPMIITFGHRFSMLCSVPLAITGWIISSYANVLWLHLISRIILGFFVSIASNSSSTFVAEISHASIRGKLVAIPDLSRQLGILFIFVAGSSHIDWRTLGLVFGSVPFLIPIIALFFIPDSPRWLATKEKERKARDALKYFRKPNYDEKELHEIFDKLQRVEKSKSVSDQFKLLREAHLVRMFILVAYILFASCFTGNFAFITYSATIFLSAKTGINEYLSTVLTGITRVLGHIVGIFCADRVGRRMLLLIPLGFCLLCTVVLGIFLYLKAVGVETSSISWLPLASLLCFTFFSSLATPVTRLIRSELFPNRVRSLVVGFISSIFFCGSFLVSLTYPYMALNIGTHWTFWIYSMNTAVMIIVVYMSLPETMGKTLEEIEEMCMNSVKRSKSDSPKLLSKLLKPPIESQ